MLGHRSVGATFSIAAKFEWAEDELDLPHVCSAVLTTLFVWIAWH
jgi:hypothetical protein